MKKEEKPVQIQECRLIRYPSSSRHGKKCNQMACPSPPRSARNSQGCNCLHIVKLITCSRREFPPRLMELNVSRRRYLVLGSSSIVLWY